MSCLVIALAMVIVVVAVASSSGYEVIDTGGMAIQISMQNIFIIRKIHCK